MSNDELRPDEVVLRMDKAVKRALNTPRLPTKELIGKTERAQSQRETKTVRARQKKPKAP